MYVTNLSEIISSITTQQTKLDLELVPKEKRLEIGKCNRRLNPGKKQREPTFQVVLDALALTLCYSAFLITANVPEVYMHQFWDSIDMYENSFRFKMARRRISTSIWKSSKTSFRFALEFMVKTLMNFPLMKILCLSSKNLVIQEKSRQSLILLLIRCINLGELFATIIKRSLSGKTTGLDKLRLSRAQILWGMYYKKNVDYVKLLWEDFTYQIDNRGHKKQDNMYYPQFTKAIIHHFLTKDKTISKRNKIGMHTSRDDYLINTLRFISAKEESQIYGARLPKSMTSPEMWETKAYNTYLGYATGVTPLKKAQKFKKPTSPKLSTVPALPEEPTRKSKRVKRLAKQSSDVPTTGVVIRETPMKSLSKKKEKMTVEKHKGIDLLFKVALIEEARNEGTSVKPGFSDVTEEESTESEAESWGRDEDDNNNDHDSRSEGSDQERDSGDDNTQSDSKNESNSEHETDENESGSESDQEENEEEDETDEEENNDEFVKTPSNDTDDEDETKIKDKAEGDEDEGTDYATNQFDDDVDLRVNEPVTTNEGFIQKEDEHQDSRLGAIRDEFMSYLSASIAARITEQVKSQLPQILLKEVSNFAPPVIKSIITESLDHAVLPKESSQPKSTYEATATLTEFELKKILIDKIDELEEPEFEVVDSNMPQDQEENPSNEDEEPKGKVASKCDWFTKPKQPQEPTDPDWNEGKTPQQGPTQSWLMTLASSVDKPSKTFSAYIMNGLKITNLTQETLLGPAFKLLKGTCTNYVELEYDFEECYKALLEKLD
ncbi:hypothetical protein Tco_0751245 [Tanacetum coccineum]|uniref:Uncharacterized protein n=1 Tax=Tanacetum coccineum TaxID=301880 RepID=A0ABQ4Z3I8_9ASTR